MTPQMTQPLLKHALLAPLTQSDSFRRLRSALTGGRVPALATGVTDSQKWHLTAGLLADNGVALAVAASELKAKEIYEDLYFFYGDGVYLYPSRDLIFYAADVKSADIARQRFTALDALLHGRAKAVVLSAEALLDRLTPPEHFMRYIVALSAGMTLSQDDLMRKLVRMGYERAAQVEGPGQFALRGGIVDIYPTTAFCHTRGAARTEAVSLPENHALRLEFFGDEIDSVRVVDTYSQRSQYALGDSEEAMLYPVRELIYSEKRLRTAIENIQKEFEETRSEFRRKNKRTEAQTLTETIGEAVQRLSEELSVNVESYFPYFYEAEINLLDYLPENTLIFYDEPNRITAHLETALAEFTDSVSHRLLAGQMLPGQARAALPYEAVLAKANAFKQVLYMNLTQAPRDFNPGEIVPFTVKSCMPLRRRPSELTEDLGYWLQQDYRVVILAGPRRHGQTLADEIAALGLPARYTEQFADTGDSAAGIQGGVVTVTRGTMTVGFEYPELKLAVVTDKEIFTTQKKRKRVNRKNKGAKIEHFNDLRPGDYIVHDNHGIGVFKGIEQIVADGITRDYIKLAYSDGGHLYVQTSQMDVIQKYIGQERVKLSKLGGADWARSKARARQAVEILASDLIALYAKRQAARGHVYGTDTVWQSEFEAMFPYTETDDQIAAIDDVKHDMESGKNMDRLICGDVGYGKTEVAIRAAFKAVQDNKQVAYLVPTTVLAQQHYLTFHSRMKDYPVTIDRLSRFQTKKEQAETVKRLTSGQVDIVIGTHRLLSKDIKFRDLGLIIVDEEQRFGVSHKEKLKALKDSVDVLTLTATPIPRTLHLSLTGIRDMSLLDEPPEERRPVQTYVMEYNAELVRDAVTRELSRGGQVYYLHNRVRNIMEEAARVQALVPQARVAYAHGQMSEHELENIMMEFIDGHVQVLVCTTIVETGLDIPNVNTIIIQDADYMGLSQLYQLRGRVGRSSRLAYAYLMYRRDKVLQENAEKRLQTIREFTEFGAGFKIAMRDLEIRGAGNLLGAEQHGHMDTVGYEMYCKLLSEAVAELRGTPPPESFETAVDISIDAYIPASYILDETQKLEVYKKISMIASEQDFFEVQEEIEDRFGDPPRAVSNLLEVALLKAEAHALGVISVAQKQKSVVLTFRADACVDVDKLTAAISRDKTLLFTMAPNPYLTCHINEGTDGLETVRVTRALIKSIQ